MRNTVPALLSSIAMLAGCSGGRYVEITGFAQGGPYSVKLEIPANSSAAALKHGMDSILNVVERSVSGYNPTSLLSKYNDGEDIKNDGSPEYTVFSSITAYSDSLFIATNGAFDTRSATLFDVWGFGFKNSKLPSDDEITAARADRSRMNFNAVAQGYSTDLIVSYLRRHGIKNMLVNIGGEMFCLGVNAGGGRWKIGIDTPEDGNDTPGAKLSAVFTSPQGVTLADGKSSAGCGIVTSGNYRKFYVHDGRKYSHTIDPRTGHPVSHNLLSATIVAKNSALADALATYCMVVGMDEARNFILSRTDLEACLISSDSLWTSPGFILEK